MTKQKKPEDKNQLVGSDKESIDTFFNDDIRLYSAVVCNLNKDPILSVISPLLHSVNNVLEIGSGTGQHAIYFAEKLPHLIWHTSDRKPYLDGIDTWLKGSGVSNIRLPIELDVSASNWPKLEIDAIFTANTLHTMHHIDIDNLFEGAGRILNSSGDFIIYGPLKYNEKYLSRENEYLDNWIRQIDPFSGIKNFNEIKMHADRNGMHLVSDYDMPSDNRILHFRKI